MKFYLIQLLFFFFVEEEIKIDIRSKSVKICTIPEDGKPLL